MPKVTPSCAAPEVANPDPSSFEEAQRDLEALVARLESGQMPLEDLLAGYQRAAQLLAYCKERLQAVESQIQQLDSQNMQNGKPS